MKIHTFLPFSRGTRLGTLCVGLLLTGGTALVFAAPKTGKAKTNVAAHRAEVKAELKAFRVDASGELSSADEARPGDVIEYQARYSNVGDGSATQFKPVLPIPGALIYQGNTAAPDEFFASTDSRTFERAPIKREVKMADGTTKSVPIPLSEYRALRWNVGTLAPGESVTVKARVRVATDAD